jgi:hypothetical protein
MVFFGKVMDDSLNINKNYANGRFIKIATFPYGKLDYL